MNIKKIITTLSTVAVLGSATVVPATQVYASENTQKIAQNNSERHILNQNLTSDDNGNVFFDKEQAIEDGMNMEDAEFYKQLSIELNEFDESSLEDGVQLRSLSLSALLTAVGAGAAKLGKALIAAGAQQLAFAFLNDIYEYGMTKACENFYGSHDLIDDFCETQDYIDEGGN